MSHLSASRERRLGSGIVTKDTKGFGLPFYECSHGKLMDVPPSELSEKVEKRRISANERGRCSSDLILGARWWEIPGSRELGSALRP